MAEEDVWAELTVIELRLVLCDHEFDKSFVSKLKKQELIKLCAKHFNLAQCYEALCRAGKKNLVPQHIKESIDTGARGVRRRDITSKPNSDLKKIHIPEFKNAQVFSTPPQVTRSQRANSQQAIKVEPPLTDKEATRERQHSKYNASEKSKQSQTKTSLNKDKADLSAKIASKRWVSLENQNLRQQLKEEQMERTLSVSSPKRLTRQRVRSMALPREQSRVETKKSEAHVNKAPVEHKENIAPSRHFENSYVPTSQRKKKGEAGPPAQYQDSSTRVSQTDSFSRAMEDDENTERASTRSKVVVRAGRFSVPSEDIVFSPTRVATEATESHSKNAAPQHSQPRRSRYGMTDDIDTYKTVHDQDSRARLEKKSKLEYNLLKNVDENTLPLRRSNAVFPAVDPKGEKVEWRVRDPINTQSTAATTQDRHYKDYTGTARMRRDSMTSKDAKLTDTTSTSYWGPSAFSSGAREFHRDSQASPFEKKNAGSMHRRSSHTYLSGKGNYSETGHQQADQSLKQKVRSSKRRKLRKSARSLFWFLVLVFLAILLVRPSQPSSYSKFMPLLLQQLRFSYLLQVYNNIIYGRPYCGTSFSENTECRQCPLHAHCSGRDMSCDSPKYRMERVSPFSLHTYRCVENVEGYREAYKLANKIGLYLAQKNGEFACYGPVVLKQFSKAKSKIVRHEFWPHDTSKPAKETLLPLSDFNLTSSGHSPFLQYYMEMRNRRQQRNRKVKRQYIAMSREQLQKETTFQFAYSLIELQTPFHLIFEAILKENEDAFETSNYPLRVRKNEKQNSDRSEGTNEQNSISEISTEEYLYYSTAIVEPLTCRAQKLLLTQWSKLMISVILIYLVYSYYVAYKRRSILTRMIQRIIVQHTTLQTLPHDNKKHLRGPSVYDIHESLTLNTEPLQSGKTASQLLEHFTEEDIQECCESLVKKNKQFMKATSPLNCTVFYYSVPVVERLKTQFDVIVSAPVLQTNVRV